jgi:hypothetical protein
LNVNNTQLQTTAASIVGVAAGYAAGHGWLGLSVSDWTAVIGGIVAVGSIIWPALATRAQSLKDTVGNMPATTVVTDKASADALPDNKSVVAATPEIVAAIKKAS